MTRSNLTILSLFLPATLILGACDRDDADVEANLDEVAQAEADDDDASRHGHRGKHMKLAKLDVDGDGFISQAEAKDHWLAHKFAKLDSDSDGKLSRDELAAFKGKHGKGRHGKDPAKFAAKMLEKLDTNGDGTLTAAEVAAKPHLAEKFAAIDSDGDGKLSQAELAAFKPEHRGKHGKGHGKDKAWHSKDPAEFAAKILQKLDSNGDGVLTANEVEGHRFADKFAKVDANGDGKISSEELTSFKAAKFANKDRPQAG